MTKPGLLLAILLLPHLQGADLPDGPGKAILQRNCVGCHKEQDFLSYRHTKEEYQAIVQRMGQRATQASADDLKVITEYLSKNFLKVEDPNKIDINTATANQIETALHVTAKEAEAIVNYRERHGDYHAWGDLLLIYGVDGKKIEAAKDKIGF